MSVRSTIEIDVHDDAFKAFHELFEKYQTQLASMPEGWRDVRTGVIDAGNAFSNAVDQAKKLASHTKEAGKAQHHFMGMLHKSSEHMRKLERGAKGVAGSIWGATRSLLKWGSLTGIVGGVIGMGGLFGLSDLARDVLDIRKSARGEGTSIGQKQAFDTNYRPYVNPGFLGAVNAAASDVSKSWVFAANGIRHSNSMSVTQLGRALISSIHTEFARTPRNEITQMIHARGLDSMGITLGEVLNIVRAKNLKAADANYFKDKSSMGLSSAEARSWAQFSVQLSRAGTQIRNVFVNGLGPMIPQLTKFSEGMVRLAIKALPDVESGLTKFATFLNSKAFAKDVKTTGKVLHVIAKDNPVAGYEDIWKITTPNKEKFQSLGNSIGSWFDGLKKFTEQSMQKGMTPRQRKLEATLINKTGAGVVIIVNAMH